MYLQLQLWIRPKLVNLLERCIDVLSTFLVTLGDKQQDQDRWCQVVVKSVLKDSRQPFVIVNWDGMPDVKGQEDIRESDQRLLPSMCNKDKGGACRVDVNVELCEAYDSDNDDCDGSEDESRIDENVMSDEEDDSDDSEEGLSDVSESDDKNSISRDE